MRCAEPAPLPVPCVGLQAQEEVDRVLAGKSKPNMGEQACQLASTSGRASLEAMRHGGGSCALQCRRDMLACHPAPPCPAPPHPAEDYMALKYCMRCVNESMRLYPHPPVLLRRAMVPDELPGE